MARWIVAGTVAVVIVVGTIAVLGAGGDPPGIAMRTIPEGVSARMIDGHPAFLVRHDAGVEVFIADARHLPGETLAWCPADQVFLGIQHGEQFDVQGRKIGGPQAGGLNRYGARVDGTRLVVRTDEVIGGPEGATGRMPPGRSPRWPCRGAVAPPAG